MARVVIAEDDDDIRQLVQFKLERAGHDVTAAADGRTAFDLIVADPPDIVILDITMPQMNGFEVCAALRQDPHTVRTPVVMLTARAQPEDIERGLSNGADEYLLKPFSPRALLECVELLLLLRT